jgi:hypothetical protein
MKIPTALLVLALASCAGPRPADQVASAPRVSGPTAEQAAQNRARPFVEGMQALERYRASEGCDNPHRQVVLEKIAELEKSLSLFHQVRSFPEYEREARDRHTQLSFAFADEALRRGCLDDADQVYRNLVAFYTGNVYAGIRDRAKLGIDDVRARRTTTGQ